MICCSLELCLMELAAGPDVEAALVQVREMLWMVLGM